MSEFYENLDLRSLSALQLDDTDNNIIKPSLSRENFRSNLETFGSTPCTTPGSTPNTTPPIIRRNNPFEPSEKILEYSFIKNIDKNIALRMRKSDCKFVIIKKYTEQKIHKRDREYEIYKKFEAFKYPFFPKLIDTFSYKNQSCIVIEYLDGINIYQLIESGNIPMEKIKSLFRRMVEIIKIFHENNIIYGDIKAENWIYNKTTDRLYLIDFESCKYIYGDKCHGTVAYLAPEMFIAPDHLDCIYYDYRADIWSLGVLLYEMIERIQPFDAPNTDAVYLRIEYIDYKFTKRFCEESKDLISKILVLAEQRITIKEILNHPFLSHKSLTETKE